MSDRLTDQRADARTNYEHEIAELRQELATLRAEDETKTLAHQRELESLRAEFAALRVTIISATQLPREADVITSSGDATGRNTSTAETGDDDQGRAASKTSRRDLLKWGGVGAAAAIAAAGGAALTSQTAHAATGDTFILGTSNTAANITQLTFDGADPTGLLVTASSPDFLTTGIIGEGTGIGVKGNATDGGGTGVLGTSGSGIGVHGTDSTNGIGVLGESTDYYGVWGQSANSIGVYGTSTNNAGVSAYSTNAIAIIGNSSSEPDLAALGTGRILQALTNTLGAPTLNYHFAGEQIRDHKGDLYLCIANGTPGTWHKVAAGIPGSSGAINFLANPIRLLDTRTSSAWLAGSTHTVQVTGVSIGGISVPSGAVGVIGNVTVVRASAGGDLRLYPGDVAPNTSSINFAAGQVIANGVTVGLNGSGQFHIKVDMPSDASANVLFDASGFIL